MGNKFTHFFQHECFGPKKALAASRRATKKTETKNINKGHMKMGSGKGDEKNDKGVLKNGQGWFLFLSALARNDSGNREKLQSLAKGLEHGHRKFAKKLAKIDKNIK